MKKLCLLFTALTLFIFLSCEIGLGSSIDTEAPSFKINTPPADAVICNNFEITGSWQDDGTISAVSVEMIRLDTEQKTLFDGHAYGSGNNSGSWVVKINPSEKKLADGHYEAIVEIKDNGGHTTTMARSFVIDNTPPVLILDKPDSTISENSGDTPVLSVFGKNLFLEGSIADSTKTTWVEMKFYSKPDCSEESYLYTIETDSIAPTNVNQNNTKYAVYEEDDLGKLIQNAYSTIYNKTEKAGAVAVYAKMTIYDTAESYASDTGNSEVSAIKKHIKGNHTSEFYIASDLAKDITRSKENGGYGYAPIDIYNLLNGSADITTEERSASEKGNTAIIDLLKTKAKKVSVFSINPDNNPYFTVSGLKTLTDPKANFSTAENVYYVKNGSLILDISVFMGSDSYAIEADSDQFYAYLIECDENGIPLQEDIEKNRIKLYSKFGESGNGANKKLLYKAAGKEGHKITKGAYVFSSPLAKSVNTNTEEGLVDLPLKYGSMYLIRVNGWDTEGNHIDNDSSKYGFKFTSSGAAPVITITEPASQTARLKKGDSLTIKGNIESEEAGIELTLSKDKAFEENIELEETENPAKYTFTCTLPKEKFDQENSKDYILTLKAANSETFSEATRTVAYDVDVPSIDITNVAPVCKKENDTNDYINGMLKIQGIVSDISSVIDTVSYEVIQNGEIQTEVSKESIPRNFKIEIDTKKLTDKTPVIVLIKAKDKAGNETRQTLNFIVDQETDKPLVRSKANLITDVSVQDLEKGDSNLFTKATTLYLDIEDDDGVAKKIDIKIKEYNKTLKAFEQNYLEEYSKSVENQTGVSYPFPDSIGIFEITVRTEDSNFVNESQTENNYSITKFLVRLTGNGPKVTLKSDSDFISTKAGSGLLKLTIDVVDEGNEPYSLYEDSVKKGDLELQSHSDSTQTYYYHYSKEYTSPDRSELHFKIKDKTGVGTEVSYTPCFDNASPEINFAADGYPANENDTDNVSFYFKGGLNDKGTAPDIPSGISQVKIIFKDGQVSEQPAPSDEGWHTANFTPSSWNYLASWSDASIKSVFQNEGKKTVFVKAIDGAGNENEDIVSKTFIYDVSAPEVTEITGKEYTNQNTLIVTIKVKDTNSIKPEVILYKGDVKEENKIPDSLALASLNQIGAASDGVYTYQAIINFPQENERALDGTYNLAVTGKDSNGRRGNTKIFRTVHDSQKPNINNVNVSEKTYDSENKIVYKDAYSNEKDKYYLNNTSTGKVVKISGVSTDNVGLKSVTLVITEDKSENAKTMQPELNGDTGVWWFETDDISAWEKGAKVHITVTDNAGNVQEYPVDITFDTKAPQAKHLFDSNNKDLYFRIGEQDRDDFVKIENKNPVASDGSPAFDSTKDKNVGGKYSEGTYGNANTITVRGNIQDSDSGVKMIYYVVFHGEENDPSNEVPDIADIVKNHKYTGKFAPGLDDSDKIKRVFYNDTNTNNTGSLSGKIDTESEAYGSVTLDGKTKFFTNIESNFLATISGFKANDINYLLLIAEDNVGNLSLDTHTVQGISYNNYKVNIDNIVPVVRAGNKFAESQYYRPEENGKFLIYGIAEDSASGIRSLLVKANGKEITKDDNTYGSLTISESGTGATALSSEYNGLEFSKKKVFWKVELDNSVFEGLENGQSLSVQLAVTDDAGTGNTETYSVASIVIDSKAPLVTIKSPKNESIVNRTITINVANSDGNGSGIDENAEPELYYSKKTTKPGFEASDFTEDADSGWEKLNLQAASNEEGWTFALDTSAQYFDDNSDIFITVSSKDKAGNTGYAAAHKLSINQDKDRPVITLSQLTKDTVTTLKTKNIYGSLTDDDGSLEKLWYWNAKTKPDAASLPVYDSVNKRWNHSAGWKEIPIDGGSWAIDSTENDGQTTWYFAVADAEKTVFAMAGTDKLKQPYIKYSDKENKVDGDAEGLTFKYDTNPPTAIKLELYKAPKGTTTSASDIAHMDNINWVQTNNIAFGGENNVLYAKVLVEESTGMKALSESAGETATSPVSISYKENAGLTYEKIHEVAGSGETAGQYTYYLGPIQMDTTEQHEFKVTVEDAVGNKAYISRSIIVDNKEPDTISQVKPKAAGEVSGDFTYRGNVSDNAGGSGVQTMEWYIPKSNESDEKADGIHWHPVSLSAGWEIEFSGENELSNIIHYSVSGSSSFVGDDFTEYETESGSGVYDIPVWFRITDAVGNVGYNKENVIKYNPNTDRPSVLISDPGEAASTTLEGKEVKYFIMGGAAARLSGSADDDEGIETIYLQFDVDGDGFWDNGVKDLTADLASLPANEEAMLANSPWTYDKVEEIKYKNGSGQTILYGYGLKAGTTKNWSYTIDLSKEGLPSINNGKTLKVRAIAVDNDSDKQLVSAPSAVINISVNNAIPLFSNLKLKQIVEDNTLVEMDYVAGKYLTGENWYITGDVSATGGITSASYTGTRKEENAKSYFKQKGDNENLWEMKIPVQANEAGVWDVSITVFDNTQPNHKQNMQLVQINIDNTPPDFNDALSGSDGETIHYLNGYGSKGKPLSSSVKMVDSDGRTSLWGKITDNGSGFDKAVFYFERVSKDGTSNPRVYNPMGANGTNRTDIEATSTASSLGKVYINSEGLPALVVGNGSVDTADMSVTRTEYTIKVELGAVSEGSSAKGVAGNSNIRKGGLIKIGGVYRTITDVSEDGRVTFDSSCDTSFTSAEIIYAMVVDSTGETTSGSGSNQTINEEDGDGLLENYTTVNKTITWNAALSTSSIPDGPIQLHVVAFDAAGNISHAFTKTGIQNNPLRITKVRLGTNLNADEKYALDSEFHTYYARFKEDGSGDTASGEYIWNLNTKDYKGAVSYWIAKKDLVVIPEFIGGSGDIYYRYDKTTGESAPDITTAIKGSCSGESPTLAPLLNSHEKIVSTLNASEEATLSSLQSGNRSGAIILENDSADGLGKLGYTNGEDSVNLYTFSFWDSTEECTIGSDTQWAVLNLRFKQDLCDNTAPEGEFIPFYWESRNKNSLVYDDKGNALGHIELPSDLPPAFNNNNEDKELDRDPKVSGKIKIEGKAFDETLLGTIKLTFDSESENRKSVTATYIASEKEWNYEGNTQAFNLTISDEHGPQQTGHSVTWTYTVDTSKIDTVAKNDVKISLEIKDTSSVVSGGNSSLVKTYQVDVVPYITGVTTAFSAKLKSSIRDAYSRTALGHYIARADETITIKGFNLGSDTHKPKYGSRELNINNGEVSFPVELLSTSGPLSIKVNNIENLNNLNDNNACGAYKTETTRITEKSLYADKAAYAYNRLPNRTSNNLLTDDLVIDIWQLDHAAAKPMSGELREPSMKINPVTGQVGLAFVSGPADIAMADTDNNNSYKRWQSNYATFSNISFAYDANGYAHATATGLDTNPDTKHAGRFSYFYNKWGPGDMSDKGNYDGINAVRLESIAVPGLSAQIETKKSFTNEDYETYKNGGTVYEEIKKYPLLINGSVPTTDSLTETRFYSPSLAATIHGTGESATTAVYLAYYDNIQKQIRFRYSTAVPQEWKSDVTYENYDYTENQTTEPTTRGEYNYSSGAKFSFDKDKGTYGVGGFKKLHHSLNDKDDFVDNLGYYKQSGNTGAEFYGNYMEANTDHFSLIAGVDYQQGDEVSEITAVRNVKVDKVDNEGNFIWIDESVGDEYEFNSSPYIKWFFKNSSKDEVTGLRTLNEGVNRPFFIRNPKTNFKQNDIVWIKVKGNEYNRYVIENCKTVNYQDVGDETVLTFKNMTDTDIDVLVKNLIQSVIGENQTEAEFFNNVFIQLENNWGYNLTKVSQKLEIQNNIKIQKYRTYKEQADIPVYKANRYKSGYDTGLEGYKYVAIDAVSGTSASEDKVVAVWYDGTSLHYAYTDNPTNGKDNNIADNNLDENNKGWKSNKIIFSEGGEHCAIKVDPIGGVHIAAYADGSLRYAYLSSVGADYNEETDSVLVDSFTITGERINLDVGLEQVGNTSTNVAVPYITYYNGTARKPTVARLVIPETLPKNYKSVIYKAQGTGTNDGPDIFTGNWEISIVPTGSNLTSQYYDKMNIGLWKVGNTSGETRQKGLIVKSNDSKFTISKDKNSTTDNSSAANQGNIYGNGTANPILGYAVESTSGTYFETAQMK